MTHPRWRRAPAILAGAVLLLMVSAGPVTTVAPLLSSVYAFWLEHGVDRVAGGFHGTLDRQGNPIEPTSKTIVQQARHLWAFSTLLRSNPAARGLDAAAARKAADSAFNFIKQRMARPAPGGGALWAYEVNRAGTATLNGAPNLYGQAFAIYGLSAYARATGSSEARSLALATFSTMDRLYHSQFGGYDETSTGFSLDSIELPATAAAATKPPSGSSAGVTTEAGSRGGKQLLSQSFNTLLHVAEGLTELSIATQGSNPTVTARLKEAVQLQTGPMVVRPSNAGGTTPAAFIAPNFDPRTWSPVGPPFVNYGHNIEAAWLLGDAVDELQARGAVSGAEGGRMRAVLQEIGEAAVAAGYDTTHGGMFDGSTLGAKSPTSSNKVWWSQAEAMLGLDWLHRRTGSAAYRTKLLETLAFTTTHLWDRQYGELYWQVGPAGGAPLAFNSGDRDFPGTTKGTAWKASYHTGRAFLRLAQAGY